MRIAHCSDLHLLSLQGARVLDFANKRWIGGLNLLTNRARHYQTAVFEAMIEDFNRGGLDHVLCTGDVTNLALEQEFWFARERFDRIALGSGAVTVLPGNHDAYIAKGNQYFSDAFGPYCTTDAGWEHDAAWPIVRVREHSGDEGTVRVALVGLSTSHQTPWFTAYGRLGDAQLARLRAILADPRLDGALRIVAIHHSPAGTRARSRIRGLRDRGALAEVLAETGAELVVHGHEHLDLFNELAGPDGPIPVRGIQSGTYAASRAERTARYRVFDIVPAGPAGTAGPAEPSEPAATTGTTASATARSENRQEDRPEARPEARSGDSPARPRLRGHWLRRWDAAAGCFVDDSTPLADAPGVPVGLQPAGPAVVVTDHPGSDLTSTPRSPANLDN